MTYPQTNITCAIKDVKRRIKWEKKEKKRLKKEREKLSRREEAVERSEKHFSYVSTSEDRRETNISYKRTRAFYATPEWKSCRNQYLESRGEKICDCCGRIPDPNYRRVKPDRNRPQWEKNKLEYEFQCNRILVDHKLPVKYYWGLRLTPSNFQLLCGVCNGKKMNEINSTHYERVMESSTGNVKTDKGVKHIELLKVIKK
tara:strand:- start:411 stop:1013 length:603 start_codon:yes stop_codon:yes gene_type:complete